MSSDENQGDIHSYDYIKYLLRQTMARRGRGLDIGRVLTEWAFIPFTDFTAPSGKLYAGACPKLKDKALDEKWGFPNDPRKYRILENYLKHIFIRLAHEEKIEIGRNYAAFDTGLVDELYNSIFALFERNTKGKQPYKWVAFCIKGDDIHRTKLAPNIHNEPRRVRFFESFEQIFFDPDKEVAPRWKHLLEDGIPRDRFPVDFLKQYKPNNMDSIFLQDQHPSNVDVYRHYLRCLEQDTRTMSAIQNRISVAIDRAKMRCRWNYKTAIPIYYTRFDRVDLILPLALCDDNKIDAALVVERINNNLYYAQTIFTLDMAYSSARLITRPDSDWLTSETASSNVREADEDHM